jgi:hypothetical protein
MHIFMPITLAARSETRTAFARFNTGIVGLNPTQAWMSVCIYSVSVMACVQVAALQWVHPPSTESYRLCKRSKTEKAAKAQQRAVEP